MITRRAIILLSCLAAAGCFSQPEVDPPAADGRESGVSDSASGRIRDDGDTESQPQALADGKTDGKPAASRTPQLPQVELSAADRDAIAKLADRSPQVREQGRAHLDSLGEKATDYLLTATADPGADVRAGATYELAGRFDPLDEQMVAVFIRALSDASAKVRRFALPTIVDVSARHAVSLAAAAEPLEAILHDEALPVHTRAQAAKALGNLDADHFDELSRTAQRDADLVVRRAALGAALEASASDERSIALLTDVLKGDAHPSLRRLAAARLAGYFGAPPSFAGVISTEQLRRGLNLDKLPADWKPPIQKAIPALAAALGDSEDVVRQAAAETLLSIGHFAVGDIAAQLDSPDRETKLLAIEILGQLGGIARSALQPLQQAARDEDRQIRQAALIAIQQIQTIP